MVSFTDIVVLGMSVVNTTCLRSILNVVIVDRDNVFDLSKTRIDFANEVLYGWERQGDVLGRAMGGEQEEGKKDLRRPSRGSCWRVTGGGRLGLDKERWSGR